MADSTFDPEGAGRAGAVLFISAQAIAVIKTPAPATDHIIAVCTCFMKNLPGDFEVKCSFQLALLYNSVPLGGSLAEQPVD
jgi:hypothetical protein